MPLRVNTNITAINTRRQLMINNRELSTRIERLSSGLRINRAADDAAGLSVPVIGVTPTPGGAMTSATWRF